jgi:hypothetical protein
MISQNHGEMNIEENLICMSLNGAQGDDAQDSQGNNDSDAAF